MDTYSQIIAHGQVILLVCGMAIAVIAGLCVIAWLWASMTRARHYAFAWRLNSMKQKQAQQIIRLDMAARERAHRQSGTHDELSRLRKEVEAAHSEITDLRKLHAVQEEVLAARAGAAERLQAKVDDLEQAHEEMGEANNDMETNVERCENEKNDAVKALAEMATIRDQLHEDLAQRELVVRMLESQVNTHQKAAEMSNANAQDLQRELVKIRHEIASVMEKNELLTRLANAKTETAEKAVV